LSGGSFDSHGFDNVGFDVGKLIVEPEGRVAADLGKEVEASVLAERVLKYWENYPGLNLSNSCNVHT
jgi:hypothetical protein